MVLLLSRSLSLPRAFSVDGTTGICLLSGWVRVAWLEGSWERPSGSFSVSLGSVCRWWPLCSVGGNEATFCNRISLGHFGSLSDVATSWNQFLIRLVERMGFPILGHRGPTGRVAHKCTGILGWTVKVELELESQRKRATLWRAGDCGVSTWPSPRVHFHSTSALRGHHKDSWHCCLPMLLVSVSVHHFTFLLRTTAWFY